MKKVKIIVMIIPLVLFFIAWAVYVYFANAEAMQEVKLDSTSIIDVHPDVIEKSMSQVQTDMELGEPFKVYPIETSPDSHAVFHSTLIEYPFGSSPRADSQNNVSLRGIVLYVHGYNDYFFQKELAEKSDSAGFAFFAIDLHYNGRSYSEGEPRSDMRSVKEYYAELDAAVALSKKIAAKGSNAKLPFVILGHSQGGLITPNYLNERNSEDFAALVLNSPFLDYKNSWFVRNVAFPVFSDIALLFPDMAAPAQESPKYNISLLKSEKGEWEFNRDLKSDEVTSVRRNAASSGSMRECRSRLLFS